jgi:3-oxoadipate enol-lactonase
MSDLRYRVDGPEGAPVLVLGNSLGSDLRMWDPQVPALAAGRRVLRFEHRGHGGTPPTPGPYTIAGLAGDLLGLLDTLGVGEFDYAGLSLGGMVGMWLAARHPGRVRRLALLCTSALLGPAQGWRDRAALVREGGTAAIVDAGVGRWLTPAFQAAHPEVVAVCRDMMLSTTPEGYAGCCEAIAAMDLRSALPAITAPTLVIAGDADPATPPDHADRIAAGIPGARLELVPAAHLATVEATTPITHLLTHHFTATTTATTEGDRDHG